MEICMKEKLVKEFLCRQRLSVQLSQRSAHLNTYYCNINNNTCKVVHFQFDSCIHPEDV
jgi:hypothetical protein